MKLLYLELKNYIGIYNGLDMDKIFIDFTKCKHNTVVIKAVNGSGKSTLLNALSPLPDDNTQMVPGVDAYKKIGLITNTGIIYDIRIDHPVKPGDLSRGTTKAKVSKTVNGEKTELNPNGNVGSFKSIIFDEFSLDPNFISLSQLGSEDRGLVDKTPSERKHLVNSIINNIEVYNNIHKTLSKRSSSFKSIVNRLISKIDNLGNKEGMIESLKSIENRINKIMNDRDISLQDLSNNKSTISLIDPDGFIQVKYNNILNRIKDIDDKLSNMKNIPYDEESIELAIKNINKDINNNTNKVVIIEKEIIDSNISKDELYKDLMAKETRLLSLQLGDGELLEKEIKDKRNIIQEYLRIFSEMGFEDEVNLTKDEYIIGVNILKDIKEVINIISSDISNDILYVTINDIFNNGNSRPDISKMDSMVNELKENRSKLESTLQEYRTYQNISNRLNIRPSDCNINTCGFIKDALDAMEKDPAGNINRIENELNQIDNELYQLEKTKEKSIEILQCTSAIDRILRYVNNNINILAKLPHMDNIINTQSLLERILLRNDFEEIDNLYKYIEYCDTFNDYTIQKDNVYKLEADYKIYMNKLDTNMEIQNEILNIQEKINNISILIEERNTTLNIINEKLKLLYLELDENEQIKLRLSDMRNISNERSLLMSEFYNIEINMEKIKNCKDNIIKIESSINDNDSILKPLLSDRDELAHSIRLYDEYAKDLEEYTLKYEKVKDIRYHCTPSTGIQVLFINVYMNKTLTLANELLSYVFNGEFVLLPYIINDKEFKIPCVGQGLPRDDISSLSNSQKSMMSMILSFVLMQQSSTIYNIPKLDEIDAPLDEANRIGFITLKDNLMRILGMEQMIMISHNTELNLENCDVIILKTENGETFGGNIIYQY